MRKIHFKLFWCLVASIVRVHRQVSARKHENESAPTLLQAQTQTCLHPAFKLKPTRWLTCKHSYILWKYIHLNECMSFEEGNKAWSCHITQDYFSGVCRGIWFRLQLHAKKQLPTRPLLLETQCIRHVEVDVFIIIPVLIFPESCFWHVLSIQ